MEDNLTAVRAEGSQIHIIISGEPITLEGRAPARPKRESARLAEQALGVPVNCAVEIDADVLPAHTACHDVSSFQKQIRLQNFLCRHLLGDDDQSDGQRRADGGFILAKSSRRYRVSLAAGHDENSDLRKP